ncbi:MAG: preprotein translocase subunit SecA [Clostridia bacterium]|nr:preprotein translocase subunit SecA [Clostridia bacterium]
MGLMNKLFGTYSERQIKKIMPLVEKIESLADEFAKKTDEELKEMTNILKERLANGETLDDILPEAFATVREADWRVLGKRPFRVQIIGGIIIHQGRIAEMKTGEGKTLVATLPAYLNALSGRGVHVITVNDYLATRDCEEMGRVYNFLGLSCGLIIPGGKNAEKRAAYACDITYGTNNEFGFDYLRDNMVIYKEHMVQRGHAFAIVDEVDSILIDEARTPLIISGQGSKPTEIYEKADKFVRGLRPYKIKEIDSKEDMDEKTEGYDYIIDEKAKTSVLAKQGIEKAEKFFGIDNLSDPEHTELAHHINQAIKAHGSMHIDEDYVVKDGEVIIVDTFTGRLMYGRRYSEGLHQAIEAKEGVKVEKESKTLATITFQNLFRMYDKLSGMTGTALTEDDEFREIYNLDVMEIPTNRPMIRKDHNDVVYKSMDMKFKAIIEQIKACNEKGQPVLVGTVSIEKSEALSRMLKVNGIKHVVLNAKYHEKEAEIVAQAGCPGAVTISTNMAGRGTDIMLGGNAEFLAKHEMRKLEYPEEVIVQATGSSTSVGEDVLAAREVYKTLYKKFKEEIEPDYKKVVEAGGLFILGTERHESRRIDNQLRGRSGRQGDPGESRFFLSFDDDLMRLFGAEERMERIKKITPDDTPIEANILSGVIESSQKRLESVNFERRKNVLMYDDVNNQQRKIIYSQRREILEDGNMRDKIIDMMEQVAENAAYSCAPSEEHEEWDFAPLKAKFRGILCTDDDFNYTDDELKKLKVEDLSEELYRRAVARYEYQEGLFGEQMREIERVVLLRCIDELWMDHIDYMQDLKGGIGLNAYAQRNPVNEYKLIGADAFDSMIADIRENTVRAVLSAVPRTEIKREQMAKEQSASIENIGGDKPAKKKPMVKKAAEKVGRNDPCPCGSGKKYKKCCGAADGSDD